MLQLKPLKNGKEWFNELNKIYCRKKEGSYADCWMCLGCTYSEKQSGLFVWAKAPDSIADVEKWIDEILYGTKVFITPGFIFGEAGRRYIRISLCCTVEMLNEALTRIEKFIEKLPLIRKHRNGCKGLNR